MQSGASHLSFFLTQMVGVAYCDATLFKIGVCEFADNDQFCNLEVRERRPTKISSHDAHQS
jgi:hypothetical protein